MKPRFALVVATLSALLSAPGCIGNHTFAEHGDELPDVAELERARLAVESSGAPQTLLDLTWIPLIALQIKRYGDSEPLLLAGNTLSESQAYGPLLLVARSDEWLFDENGELYEQRERFHFLWGLWASRRTDVRVPTGWRIDEGTSLLFGLLRWPTTVYVRDEQAAHSD